jgi:hypothetical protein
LPTLVNNNTLDQHTNTFADEKATPEKAYLSTTNVFPLFKASYMVFLEIAELI